MSENNYFINKYRKNSEINQEEILKKDNISENENKQKVIKPYIFKKIEEKEEKKEEKIEERSNKSNFTTNFTPPISKKRLAALLLILSGIEKSSKIIKNFNEDEIIKALNEIFKIEFITKEELDIVEKNFGKLNITDLSKYKGGKDFARELVQKSFGMSKGSEYFIKAIEEDNINNLSFLEQLKPEQIKDLLQDESDYIISLILGLLNPKISSSVLNLLPKEKLPDIIKKLSNKIEVNSDVLNTVIKKLKEKIITTKEEDTIKISGKNKLIEILRNSDPDKSSELIKIIENEEPDLAEELKENIFTFEDIVYIKKKDMEKALKNYPDKEIAFILKGATDNIKTIFFTCLPKRRKQNILDEIELLGEVKKSDVLQKRKEFIRYLKVLDEKGDISIKPDKEIYVS